jgi:hypothetical protein
MSLRLLEFADYLKDNLGKVLIAVGLILVILGVLTLAALSAVVPDVTLLVPAVSLFLGIVFVVYGFFVQVGLFSVRWTSVNGVGTILLCISVGFFALAIVAIQFQLITGFEVFGTPNNAFLILIPYSIRPFLFLFAIGLQLGVVFFVASVILKAFSFWRR